IREMILRTVAALSVYKKSFHYVGIRRLWPARMMPSKAALSVYKKSFHDVDIRRSWHARMTSAKPSAAYLAAYVWPAAAEFAKGRAETVRSITRA
ncbi:hypothetical protein FRC01_011559, partial [Tulasnella sp. 417]